MNSADSIRGLCQQIGVVPVWPMINRHPPTMLAVKLTVLAARWAAAAGLEEQRDKAIAEAEQIRDSLYGSGLVALAPPVAPGPLLVTFKVTADGEQGHPMDHLVKRVDVDTDGEPTQASLDALLDGIRREIKRKLRNP